MSRVPVTQASWGAGADIHSAVFFSVSPHNMAHIRGVRLRWNTLGISQTTAATGKKYQARNEWNEYGQQATNLLKSRTYNHKQMIE